MPLFDIGNLMEHFFKGDNGVFVVEFHVFRHAFDQHKERVANLAQLFAIGAHVRKNIRLDLRCGGLPERDVDETELAADRAHERGKGANVLYDVARKREFEDWHASLRER